MPEDCTHPRSSPTEVVLAVSLRTPERRALAALSDAMSWRLVCARGLAQALRKAKSRAVRVLLCERDLPEGDYHGGDWPQGDWKVLLEQIRDLAHAPRFIVVSRLADERLWAEVLNLGGHDVLATPFDPDEVTRVMSYAMTPALKNIHAGSAASRSGGSWSGGSSV